MVKCQVNCQCISYRDRGLSEPQQGLLIEALLILSLGTVVIEVRRDHVRNVSNWIGREPKLLEFGYHTRYLVQGGTDIIPNRIVKTIDTT